MLVCSSASIPLDSIRKEKKVKPGFTPAEDIGRFRPSRVLRAQAEEVEAKQKGSILGYESVQVEAARKAMAKATISSTSSSNLSSSSSRPSDDSWRRAAPDCVDTKARSTSTWRTSKGSSASSSSSSASAANGTWRKRQEPVSKEEIPDDWEEEDKKEPNTKAPLRNGTDGGAESSSIIASDTNNPIALDKIDALKKKIKTAQALKDKHDQSGKGLLAEQQAKVDSLEEMIGHLGALGVTEEDKKQDNDR